MFNFLTYLKLKNRNWERYSLSKKLSILQKIENIEAHRQHRQPMRVSSKHFDDDMQGLCDYDTKNIYISDQLFSQKFLQFYALAVIYHEGRHAYQQEIASSTKKPSIFSHAYWWKKNLQGYVNFDEKEKFSYYAMQDVERDANKYALKRLKSLHFWLKDEKGYAETIKSKQDELDTQVTNAKKELGPFYKFRVKWRNKMERDKEQKNI